MHAGKALCIVRLYIIVTSEVMHADLIGTFFTVTCLWLGNGRWLTVLLSWVSDFGTPSTVPMLRSIQVVKSCSRDHVILVITSSRLANGTHFNADRQFRQT